MRVLVVLAFIGLWLRSELRRIASWRHRATVWHEHPYHGQPILLLALYQKGRLRPDTESLARIARDRGFYVIGVNTLRLDDPGALADRFDCYIERFNFGRDFGSYKLGFRHLYQRGMEQSCPRLIMANDSVFYCADRLPGFLDAIAGDGREVLGGTENHEISRHVGSFWIALTGRILTDSRFKRFWARYVLSDVRPVVILRGEMGLSRLLARCASSPDRFGALYGAPRFVDALADPGVLDMAIKLARTSPGTGWRRLDREKVLALYTEQRAVRTDRGGPEARKPVGQLEAEREKPLYYINSFSDFRSFVAEAIGGDAPIEEEVLRRLIVSELTETFLSGSQVHQNAAILLRLGLPIVKLDGLYRGIFSVQDVEQICAQLAPEEAGELRRLLFERPYGGDTLRGLRRAAFMYGLI